MSRERSLLWVLVVSLCAALGGGALSATTNAVGKVLPPDAAPPDQQRLVGFSAPAETVDGLVSQYHKPTESDANSWSDLLSNGLVRVDKNDDPVPAGAKSWEVSKDGLTWTFHLDKAQVWTDGTPVTADDYVASFRYGADPKHAWDFAWYFGFIKGWGDALKGAIPVEKIGVERGEDPYTLVVRTSAITPYLPNAIIYSNPLNAQYLAKYGPYYNNDPKTSISSGPYVLQEWTKDQRVVFAANPKYTGIKPYITRVEIKFADMVTEFQAYRNNEVDIAANFSPADIQAIQSDPDLRAQYHRGLDNFRIYYLSFDTTNPPFNNLEVRQAFSHAVDREGLVQHVIGVQGIVAHGMLGTGFPGSHQSDLAPIQRYDLGQAKRLLAEAGYPEGKGFPRLTMWLRDESALGQAIGNAIAAQLKQNLGVDVEVSNKDRKLFMDTLNGHKLQFYMVPYGMDYLDPSNMLGIWLSGGRHTWANEKFDNLVRSASSMMGETNKRMAMFHEAEEILVSDAGFIPIYQTTPGFMWKPYVSGVTKNKQGFVMWPFAGWPGYSTLHQYLYITNDVGKYRR